MAVSVNTDPVVGPANTSVAAGTGGVVVFPSAVKTASGTGADFVYADFRRARSITWVIDVTAVNAGVTTLNVAVNVKIGGKYIEVARTANLVATAASLVHQLLRGVSFTTGGTLAALASPTGASATTNYEWDDTFAVAWTVSGGATPSATIVVTAYPMF